MPRSASPLPPPARYVPVRPTPLAMVPGLRAFGTDFGNGDADRLHFQMDCERERYLAAKAAVPATRHFMLARDTADQARHATVVAWMRSTLALEHPAWTAARRLDTYADLSAAVQEDFAVIAQGSGGRGEAIAASISFPSGWRPERIRGADFAAIHGPVPGFADHGDAARAMVRAMIERGPYVRFVWTITADDHLDHHPDHWRSPPWSTTTRAWLRVERQVTVPFPARRVSLFLIRTYCYAFETLEAGQRRTLQRALETMPPDVARYKGLTPAVRARAAALLEANGGRHMG